METEIRNDVDSIEEMVYIPTENSGSITGSLTVDDGVGGISNEQFTIEIQTRNTR